MAAGTRDANEVEAEPSGERAAERWRVNVVELYVSLAAAGGVQWREWIGLSRAGADVSLPMLNSCESMWRSQAPQVSKFAR